MTAPLVRFVICTHNNRQIIDACLESIKPQTYPHWECVVVDDASTDGTPDWIREHHSWVTVLQNPDNRGPAYSRNAGMANATAEYIAFLDSDVQLDPQWLEKTVGVLHRDDAIGIVGGKLLLAASPDRLHSYGGVLSRIGVGWNVHESEEHASLTEPVECLWVCSAAMLTRRGLMQRIGGFDETFFYGYEDSDLGWRAQLVGYRALCIPDAVAYHAVSETVSKMGDRIVFHAYKNRLRSMLKNYAAASLVKYLPIYLLYSIVDALVRPPAPPKLRAWWWNVTVLRDTLQRRAEIQRTRTQMDADISPLLSPRFLTPATLRRSRRQLAARLARAE